jgi:hypothetical protein
MPTHKFAVGQKVRFSPDMGQIARRDESFVVIAHSGERDQPIRLKVITDSGDRDHADHGQ